MRILIGLFALMALFALGAPGSARAAQPPRVQAYDCGYLAATKGPANVWRTTFRGQRDALFGPDQRYFASPCFTSKASCTAWLYWAQSDWPKLNSFTPCRKGIRY